MTSSFWSNSRPTASRRRSSSGSRPSVLPVTLAADAGGACVWSDACMPSPPPSSAAYGFEPPSAARSAVGSWVVVAVRKRPAIASCCWNAAAFARLALAGDDPAAEPKRAQRHAAQLAHARECLVVTHHGCHRLLAPRPERARASVASSKDEQVAFARNEGVSGSSPLIGSSE